MRLFAARMPLTWATEMPVAVELRRIEGDHDLRLEAAGQVDRRHARRCPGAPGTISVRATSVGGVETVLAGAGDRGDDHGRRVDVERRDLRRDAGGQAGRLEVLLDRRADLLDVGAELELGHDDGDRVGRRGGERREPRDARRSSRSIGFVDLLGDVGGAHARVAAR